MIALGCVTGRFQPVHRQHVELFQHVLGECAHLIVAMTNPDPGALHQEPTSSHRHTAAANPLSFYQRVRLLEAVFDNLGLRSRATMVPFDLTEPALLHHYVPVETRHYVRVYSAWEQQKCAMLESFGYRVTTLQGDVAARVSASEIRDAIRRQQSHWRALVPEAITAMLPEMLLSASMQARS